MNNPFLNIALFIFMFSSYGITQQNLVPNPSFEEHSSCPLLNDLGDGQFTRCTDWWYPSFLGTPDYFCACNDTIPGANQGIVSVPNNFQGYQHAFDGECYVGAGQYEVYPNNGEVVGREMIRTKLLSPLKACTTYELTMRVSAADKSTHLLSKLQFLLTKENEEYSSFSELVDVPYQELEIANIDTIDWRIVKCKFQANGGECYLTIGDFGIVDTTELIFNDSAAIYIFGTYFPYFYIDSVNLKVIGEVTDCLPILPNFFSPNGDGDNDFFTIESTEIKHLQIVNRWGNQIKELDALNPVWDGKDNSGIECVEGTYYFIGDYQGTPLNGFIQLVR